jgi:hypothetical protein
MRWFAILLVAPVVAHAQSVTVGAGENTVDRDVAATLDASGTAGETGLDKAATTESLARLSSELRTGSSGTELAGTAAGHLSADYDVGSGIRMPLVAFWADGSLGKRPALDARRDLAREDFAETNVGFRLSAPNALDDRRASLFRFGFGGNRVWQGNVERSQITAEFELAGYCRVRPTNIPFCLHILELDGTGVSGGKQATVTNISFVRAVGLAGHFELGIGMITDGIAIGNDASHPENDVVTEDLPDKNVLAGTVGAIANVGPIRVDAHAARTGYVSLDHDLSIEDRATVSASISVDKNTAVVASGFAARTRWWSSAADPGSSASTGGAELGVTTRLAGFDVKANAGLAQTFYPTLDGAAVDTPAVGFRSTLQVARTIGL